MIYVHIPFCRSFCTYCDFYSEVAPKCREREHEQSRMFGRFSEALKQEISLRADEITDEYNTIYIGGGTPSVLPLSVYSDLVGHLAEVGIHPPFKEFTFELNPEDVVESGEPYIRGLMDLGVDRFSMGVQSFDDGILKWMNRRHDSQTARRAYGILEQAGAENISIDLIFGLPQMDDSMWMDTIANALAISLSGKLPCHISAYQLSVEPGSALAAMVEKGVWSEASQEQCARQYGILCDMLARKGYHHYEISNFALPGFEAKHNGAYWRHVPYVGLGPGAHSLLITQSPEGDSPQGHRRPDCLSVFCSKIPDPGAASDDALLITQSPEGDSPQGYRRLWNEPDLEAYMKNPTGCRGCEELTREQVGMEKVMLELRTSSGAGEDFLLSFCGKSAVDAAMADGNLIRTGSGNLRIPEDRFFISDSIITGLI